jgi:hypothetical protein
MQIGNYNHPSAIRLLRNKKGRFYAPFLLPVYLRGLNLGLIEGDYFILQLDLATASIVK